MKRSLVAVVLASALLCAGAAMADKTSVTYAPGDGGTVALPTTANRKAMSLVNGYDVAICVSPSNSSVCYPVLPGGTLNVDVLDNQRYSVRLCGGSTVADCLPDGGIVTLEVQ